MEIVSQEDRGKPRSPLLPARRWWLEVHLDTQVMKPLATAEFTIAKAVAFTRQLESIHRSGKWTSETLTRWTSTASQRMITCDLVNRKAVAKSTPMEWLTWPPERVNSKFKEIYSAHRDVRYVTPEDFWLTKAKSFKPEAVRPGDAAGPTHSLRSLTSNLCAINICGIQEQSNRDALYATLRCATIRWGSATLRSERQYSANEMRYGSCEYVLLKALSKHDCDRSIETARNSNNPFTYHCSR